MSASNLDLVPEILFKMALGCWSAQEIRNIPNTLDGIQIIQFPQKKPNSLRVAINSFQGEIEGYTEKCTCDNTF